MSIDISKPWFPQDYTLEEVKALINRRPFDTDEQHAERMAIVESDYRIRAGGVAGIFNDLRLNIIERLGNIDEEGVAKVDVQAFKDRLKYVIADAIYKLEGGTIPDTKFVVHEYAIPTFHRDEPPVYNCKTSLLEETRVAKNIADRYWSLVNSDKPTE